MTDIDQIPLKLLNDARAEVGLIPLNRMALATSRDIGRAFDYTIDKLIATEQKLHDFRQEVSDAVVDYFGPKHLDVILAGHLLSRFIPKPKPDPLVAVLHEVDTGPEWDSPEDYCNKIRAALEARGLEIRSKANANSKTD